MLQKLKTELKRLYHSSHTIALSKGTILAKNADFLQKICWHQQNYEGLRTTRYIFWN